MSTQIVCDNCRRVCVPAQPSLGEVEVNCGSHPAAFKVRVHIRCEPPEGFDLCPPCVHKAVMRALEIHAQTPAAPETVGETENG